MINTPLADETLETAVVKSENDRVKQSVNQPKIKDGMLILQGLNDETVETLMIEYYELDEQIVKQLEQPVKRGFFTDSLDEEGTLNSALPVLLACYRQRAIKSILQGQVDLPEEDEPENSDIKVMREFLDTQ